jgi:NADH dehydrogenase
VASVAIQQADLVAENLKRFERKLKTFYEYEYHDKGSMATVGRNKAVVDIPKPKMHLKGFFAWIIWMGLHLFLILGVKNRIIVFVNWIYNYFTYDQSLRLIFKEFYRPRAEPLEVNRQGEGSPANLSSAQTLHPSVPEPARVKHPADFKG